MTNRQVLEPTPSHPITVLPTGSHVVVRVNGQIVAETDLDVSFSILVRAGTTADQVRTIGAYPHAGAQVRGWISENLPQAEVVLASGMSQRTT